MQGTILIIDDNKDLAFYLKKLMSNEGFEAAVAYDAVTARKAMDRMFPDAVLMDIKLPDADGVELMCELKDGFPKTQFIMMTAFASIKSAIESIKIGAYDYLAKPFDSNEMLNVMRNAVQEIALQEEVNQLRSRYLHLTEDFEIPRYPSAAMNETLNLCVKVASGQGNILITGESGVGKNHLAGMIHRISNRSKGAFFDVNCASLSPSLIESELFGHEPGAFTGAKGRKRGLLELSSNGTLFLDEIGDMPFHLQAKLLSFLDTHTLRRVGGERVIEVNARVIAATNRDLKRLVQEGSFREDLFYRLNVVAIQVPPLRERIGDIPVLVTEILQDISSDMGLQRMPKIAPGVLEKLKSHSWPGNVRELKNVLERALLLSSDPEIIRAVKLDAHIIDRRDEGEEKPLYEVRFPENGTSIKNISDKVDQVLVTEALRRAGTKKEAATMLGISRDSLAHYTKKLGLDR
ncbi:response regulator [candidate division KSB3 bacterium]|nr:response regulator [candidate division KSB3 bacterium]